MAFLFLTVGACTDTLVQPKSTISEGNVFADVGSYKKFLAKIYADWRSPGSRAERDSRTSIPPSSLTRDSATTSVCSGT